MRTHSTQQRQDGKYETFRLYGRIVVLEGSCPLNLQDMICLDYEDQHHVPRCYSS